MHENRIMQLKDLLNEHNIEKIESISKHEEYHQADEEDEIESLKFHLDNETVITLYISYECDDQRMPDMELNIYVDD